MWRKAILSPQRAAGSIPSGGADPQPTRPRESTAVADRSSSVELPFVGASVGRCEDHRQMLVTMQFASSGVDRSEVGVACVRIEGVSPVNLHSVRVVADGVRVFEMNTAFDEMGRTMAAGELVSAIFSPGHTDGICISGTDFSKPVRLSQAAVEIKVSAADLCPDTHIRVSCDLDSRASQAQNRSA